MTNPNHPIVRVPSITGPDIYVPEKPGLTKRELFALELAKSLLIEIRNEPYERLVQSAVYLANVMIEELNKSNGENDS